MAIHIIEEYEVHVESSYQFQMFGGAGRVIAETQEFGNDPGLATVLQLRNILGGTM